VIASATASQPQQQLQDMHFRSGAIAIGAYPAPQALFDERGMR
jgi:hypothetical protein